MKPGCMMLHATMQHYNGENATYQEVGTYSVSSFTKQKQPSNTWLPVDVCCATCWVGKGDGVNRSSHHMPGFLTFKLS